MLVKNFNFVITNNAIKYFNKLVNSIKSLHKVNLKVFVKNKNTCNANINLIYCFKGEEEKTDVLLHFNFFNLYFSNTCSFYLKNSFIDFFNKKLIIKSPFLKKKMRYKTEKLRKLRLSLELFVLNKINKILEQHGGFVKIKRLTFSGILIITFSGNCSSCYSLQNTFQNIVKKEILKNYTQIVDVVIRN